MPACHEKGCESQHSQYQTDGMRLHQTYAATSLPPLFCTFAAAAIAVKLAGRRSRVSSGSRVWRFER